MMRTRIADSIDDLLNVNGATHVVIAVDATAARRLADDLRWCDRSRDPANGYTAEIRGSIKEPS